MGKLGSPLHYAAPSFSQQISLTTEPLGSPNGLPAAQIAPETRVNTVADVFDVLSHSRSYKDPTPVAKLLDILDGGRGTQFDGKVLDAFYRQPADKVLPYMLADGSLPSVARPEWLPAFKDVEIGELLKSVKVGKPIVGSRVSQAQIDHFNSLYHDGSRGTDITPEIVGQTSGSTKLILPDHSS